MQGRVTDTNSIDNNNTQLQANNINKWVVNLSKTSLTEGPKSVLAKGPNFSRAPKYIPNVDYITAVESMCPKLKEEDAMELRANINSFIKESPGTQTKSNKAGKVRISSTQKG